MKLTKAILVLSIASGLAWGQTPDLPNRMKGLLANPPAQGVASSQPAAKSSAPEAKAQDAAQGETMVKAGEGLPLSQKSASGKRDPFLTPVVERAGGPGQGCAAGKRCLVIDQMVLRGIVRTPNGMIAVVANAANKAYFLKEKDPVFNGVVVKITGDSVVFKEHSVDNVGHTVSREVVKRVHPAPLV